LYERALRFREREFGPDHSEIGKTVNGLGNAWSGLGQHAKARELYERALRIYRIHFPGGHPAIVMLAHDMRAVAPEVIVLDNGLIGRE
jgi:tetratricopeptide (TPR) repeat protein